YAALDVTGQRVVVGHVDPRRGWVTETTFAAALTAGTDYVLDVFLKDTVATVSLNGNVLGSWVYNAAVADSQTGVVTRGGTSSFARADFKPDDRRFTGTTLPPELRIADTSIVEGNSGTSTALLTLTLTQPRTIATTVGWKTIDGTATAGSDYVGVSAGTVTI